MGACNGKSTEFQSSGNYIINFYGAENVPKSDMTSESDPFIKSYIKRAGRRVSKEVKTLFRDNNKNPIWNSYQNFGIDYGDDLSLYVEVHDMDTFSSG